jgi:uncharacterized protein (DUF4213/DUF364 family)
MWELYDALIEKIPTGLRVDEAVQGGRWTMIRSGGRAGLASSGARFAVETRPGTLPACLTGMTLRKLAESSKSWNFTEAALGVAAMGAWYNSPEHEAVARALRRADMSAFDDWRERARGKKAAVIGHFPHLEKSMADVCDLAVLEKRPQSGDYPDSACEFLLPVMDLVFATGVTITNKTLPRLLELSKNSAFILVGPSVPLAPCLFGFGLRDLQGFVVTDIEKCRDIITGGRPDSDLFTAGKRVSIYSDG